MTLQDEVNDLNVQFAHLRGQLQVIGAVAVLIAGGVAYGLFFKVGERGPAGTAVPVGTVIAWPGQFDFPGGKWIREDETVWALCDGKTITVDPEGDPLFDAIGRLYERKGDNFGDDTIRLPSFQGRFLRGLGSAGEASSSALGVPQGGSVGKHSHTLFADGEAGANAGPLKSTRPILEGADDGGMFSYRMRHTIDGARPKFGTTGREPHGLDDRPLPHDETHPVNYAVHWLIRVE